MSSETHRRISAASTLVASLVLPAAAWGGSYTMSVSNDPLYQSLAERNGVSQVSIGLDNADAEPFDGRFGLAGFDLNFAGTSSTGIWVTTNGAVYFGGLNDRPEIHSPSGDDFESWFAKDMSNAARPGVAAFHDWFGYVADYGDFDPENYMFAPMWYLIEGSRGSRTLTFEWNPAEYVYFNSASEEWEQSPVNGLSYQFSITEGSSDFTLRYGSMGDYGGKAEVGLRTDTETLVYRERFMQDDELPVIAANTTLQFTWGDPAVIPSPAAAGGGIVLAGITLLRRSRG